MFYLFLILLVLTIISYYCNNKQFAAPSFLFCFSFLASSFVAMLYAPNWGFKLSKTVFYLIILSVIEFILISWLISLFLKSTKKNTYTINNSSSSKLKTFRITKGKKIIIIIVELFTIITVIYCLKSITGAGNLSSALAIYRIRNTFSNRPIPLPRIAAILWRFSFAASFFFAYQLIKEKIIYNKWDKYLIIIFFLGVLISMLQGNRTATIYLLIATFIFYCLLNSKNNYNKKNIYLIFFIIVISVSILCSFKRLALMLGRTEVQNMDLGAYLAEYLGAEIANLDYFIKTYSFPTFPSFLNSQTFINISTFLNSFLNTNNNVIPNLNIFRIANGYDMGNVYTTFMPWLADWGYQIVPFFIFIEATLSELFYKRININEWKVPINALIYAYMGVTLFFSFFANKFFGEIFNITFLYQIITWIFLDLFMFPSKYKN